MTGDNWPVFLYHGYNFDSDDPWNGLFRSALLVTVSVPTQLCDSAVLNITPGVQTHLHVSKLR